MFNGFVLFVIGILVSDWDLFLRREFSSISFGPNDFFFSFILFFLGILLHHIHLFSLFCFNSADFILYWSCYVVFNSKNIHRNTLKCISNWRREFLIGNSSQIFTKDFKLPLIFFNDNSSSILNNSQNAQLLIFGNAEICAFRFQQRKRAVSSSIHVLCAYMIFCNVYAHFKADHICDTFLMVFLLCSFVFVEKIDCKLFFCIETPLGIGVIFYCSIIMCSLEMLFLMHLRFNCTRVYIFFFFYTPIIAYWCSRFDKKSPNRWVIIKLSWLLSHLFSQTNTKKCNKWNKIPCLLPVSHWISLKSWIDVRRICDEQHSVSVARFTERWCDTHNKKWLAQYLAHRLSHKITQWFRFIL